VIDIVTGDNTPVALKVDGTVWIWGRDQRNVNINTMIAPSIKLPQQLTGISQVTAISAGHSHGIALKADGTVWWWGRYNYPITVAAVPTQVQGLSGVKAITSDYALKTDGTLWKLNISSTPTQVTSLSGVSSLIQVSAGGSIPYAIKTDGGIWKLGTTPTQVTNLSGLTVISDSVGIGNLAYSTVALKSDGTVWNWEASASPIQVSGLSGITAISTGSHVLVLKSDGSVWSWGLNRDGGLGDGTTTDRATPVQVSGILLK
jgi:alpha-tubulin suppressor-like RCC1 family protein